MRRLFFLFLPLPLLAVVASCIPLPLDLGPAPKDCATRPGASLEILPNDVDGGPGPEDAGLLISNGVQGGYHIWVNVKAHHLGPTVLVQPTVTDAKTGEVLSQSGLQEVEDLAPFGEDNPIEPDGGWDVRPVQGRLSADPATVIGRTVILSAKLTDACPHSAGGSRTGLVTGHEPSN